MTTRTEIYDSVWDGVDALLDERSIAWRLITDDFRVRPTIRGFESAAPWCHYQMDLFLGRHPQVQFGAYDDARLVARLFDYVMVEQHEQQHVETMLATHQLRVGPPLLGIGGALPSGLNIAEQIKNEIAERTSRG